LSTETLRNFVNGQQVNAADGRTSEVVNPATGEAYAAAPLSSAADVDAAMTAAAAAFESWRDTTPGQRQLALDIGCVWVNTHIPIVAEMPHGGFKHSGHGKDLSMYGFEDYTRIKHVMSNIEV
jgi:acyl-CoA reductase-like NAD-dependent aldehyde dehydrogenase